MAIVAGFKNSLFFLCQEQLRQRLPDIRHLLRNLSWVSQFSTQVQSPKRPPRLRSVKMLTILIVEDETLVAMDLEMMITKIVPAAIVIESSVAATKKVLHEALDFALMSM